MLLPGLDQAPLYNNLSVQFITPLNAVVVATYPNIVTGLATNIPALRCPSDTGSNTVTAGTGTITVFGRSNYPGVYGAAVIPAGAPAPTGTVAGTFFINSRRNFSAYTDGLSNTIIVGERRSVGTQGATTVGGEAIWAGPYVAATAIADNYTLGQTAALSLNTINSTDATYRLSGFGSLHVGGAHFLLGDGGVRFISENIFSTTYANLASIADNNVIGDF